MVLSEVMFDTLEKGIPFWCCQFTSTHEVTSLVCFAYGCQAVMCHFFINECILHLAGHGQMPENCIIGQERKRWYFHVSRFLLLKIFWGVFCVSKDQNFSWKTKFLEPPLSPYSWCIEADSLWPVCRQPNRNSHRSENTFSSTEVNILSQRNASWTARMWAHAYIVLFSSLWGWVGRGMH